MRGWTENMYWARNKEWYVYDPVKIEIHMTEKAPQKAVESFQKWLDCISGDDNENNGK